MLAYQMIYTACGPNKTGAFDLWAKSQNVTKEEWSEIVKVMGYRKPRELSYDATEEETERVCPKKCAYIELSTGRKCLAKSNYIGKVYSDEDARSGNFIIHAYIFDDLGELRPSSIFISKAFKSKLTYKEWHDDPVPTDLPAVELQEPLAVNEEQNIRALLASRKTEICALLQATLNAVSQDKTVTFNADDKTQELIYHLISMLLPKAYYEKATFCTRYLASADYAIGSEGLATIRLRNILFEGMSGAFNYQEELTVGEKYVFSFDENLFSNVTPGKYVTDIVDTFIKGSLFDAVKKAETIGNIAKKAGCDLDTAIAIYQIAAKNFAWFIDVSEFRKAYELALSAGYATKETYVPLIYANIVKPKVWGYDSRAIELTKYVFENSDVATRDAIIEDYYVNMSSYGVQMNGDPAAFAGSVKSCAPFPWSELVASVMRNRAWDARIDNASTLALNYLFYDIMFSVIEQGANQNDKSIASARILNIARKAVAKKDLNEIKLYFQRGKAVENWLIENTTGNLFDCSLMQADMDFALRLIFLIGDTQEKYKLMERVFGANLSAPYFLPEYVKYAQSNEALFTGFERTVANKPLFQDFFLKKDAYVFQHDRNVTAAKLDNYCNKYYKTRRDNGVYFAKLQEYYATVPAKSLLAESLRIYKQICGLDNDFPDLKKIIAFLEREIYSLSTDDLMRASVDQRNTLKEINVRVQSLGIKSSSQFETIETLSLIQGKAGKEARRQAIIGGTLYGTLSGKAFSDFACKHLSDILDAYAEEIKPDKKQGEINSVILLKSMFEPIFLDVNVGESAIIKAMQLMPGKEFYKLMTEFMIYGFTKSDGFAMNLKRFVKLYVGKMTRGEWKKLFKKAEDILDDLEETDGQFQPILDWFDEHRKANKSFWEVIFPKREKPAKDEEEEDDEDDSDDDKKKKKKKK